MTVSQAAPPGWFPDPERAGYERRWDGTTWVGTPHKTPVRWSMLGSEYDRSRWTNANRAAAVARWVGLVGVLPILAWLPVVAVVDRELWVRAFLIAVIVAIPAETVTVVAGAIAVSHGRRCGAYALSILMTVSSSVLLLTYLMGLAVVIVSFWTS